MNINELLTLFYKEVETRTSDELSHKQYFKLIYWSIFRKKRLKQVMLNVVDGMSYHFAFKEKERNKQN